MKVATIIKRIEHGQPFRVSFENRTLTLNGSVLKSIEFEMPDNVEDKLLEYFENYKYSVPSAKANSKYFFGLDESHLSTKQLAENENRYIARAKLEIYVLGLIVNNKWSFEDKQWYWQSRRDTKLTLFRKWFDHKEF